MLTDKYLSKHFQTRGYLFYAELAETENSLIIWKRVRLSVSEPNRAVVKKLGEISNLADFTFLMTFLSGSFNLSVNAILDRSEFL